MVVRIGILCLCALLSAASAVKPPVGWGDFQMGLVNNGRSHWDGAMREALEVEENGVRPYQLDRRYIYMDDTTNMKAYWGVDGVAVNNWSRNDYYESKGVKPAIVIYMLQRGGDSWSAVEAGMSSREFMHDYFTYIATIADSSKGTQPIYVLEPDVWTYMLQQARENDPGRYTTTIDDWSKIEDNNFESFCHINDLGLPWLEEFENKASNLPGAVIKTLKMVDPGCYAGILIGFWGWQPAESNGIGLFTNSSDIIGVGARETAKFTAALINSTPYRGDFAGLEKNGQDAGYWTGAYASALTWDDRQNAAWVDFAKTISTETDLPLVGWQISIGHEGLPNSLNSYEDTFFPYFFEHTQDFIDAGVIGMLAGVAGQDRGTMAVVPGGKTYTNPSFGESTRGDEGWFYREYAKFNSRRPWVQGDGKNYHRIIAEVVPDSLFTPGEVTDPDWDASYQYGSDDHGKSFHYKGRQYEFIGYWGNVGKSPVEDRSNWRDLGLYGTLEVTVGGTIWNGNIYYESGARAVHAFNPAPIEGYGIGTVTVNGDTVDPTDRITVESIDRDYEVRVTFVKGGAKVAVNHEVGKPENRYALFQNSLRLHEDAAVSLFSLRGQRVLRRNSTAGTTVDFSALTPGIYIARIRGRNWVQQQKIHIR